MLNTCLANLVEKIKFSSWNAESYYGLQIFKLSYSRVSKRAQVVNGSDILSDSVNKLLFIFPSPIFLKTALNTAVQYCGIAYLLIESKRNVELT